MKALSFHTSTGPEVSKNKIRAQFLAINKSQALARFDPAGYILAANQNFLDIVGYTLAEVTGKHHAIFVDEQERSSAEYRAFWQKLGGGHYDAGCYKRIAKNGREIWLQASYNPIVDKKGLTCEVIKIATDVTEQQLRDAEAQCELEAISKVQAIVEFKLDGTIVAANELFLDALGYTREEITGRHHKIFVQPEEANSAEYQQFWQRLANGEHQAGQFLRIGKGGREVWIDATYTPILDASGHPFKVVKYANNITQRFVAAQTLSTTAHELEQTVDRVAEANKLAQQASDIAQTGGQNVQNVVSIMQDITESSHNIAEIIGLMDQIASQTKFLATNAAVEAARAGEHGRGFAVVAAEVQKLAQNSTSAAKEVRDLIKNSNEQAERGSVTVESTGKVMDGHFTATRRYPERGDRDVSGSIRTIE